jgi:hypothetical protein
VLCAVDKLSKGDVPHTMLFTRDDGEWLYEPLNWSAVSSCVVEKPKQQLLAAGPSGLVLVFGQGDQLEEHVLGKTGAVAPGAIREVRDIAGRGWAAGMGYQAYRREKPGRWKRVGAGLPKPKAMHGFESIHGFSESEIYAVGWHGEIWRCDGKKWSPVKSPTQVLLTRVLCAGDGTAYACGQGGVLVAGRRDRWRVIEHDSTSVDLWDLEWFAGRLWVSSSQFIYTLDEGELKLVDFGDDVPDTCYHLSAKDGTLWSIGAKDIMETRDGRRWTRIE